MGKKPHLTLGKRRKSIDFRSSVTTSRKSLPKSASRYIMVELKKTKDEDNVQGCNLNISRFLLRAMGAKEAAPFPAPPEACMGPARQRPAETRASGALARRASRRPRQGSRSSVDRREQDKKAVSSITERKEYSKPKPGDEIHLNLYRLSKIKF